MAKGSSNSAELQELLKDMQSGRNEDQPSKYPPNVPENSTKADSSKDNATRGRTGEKESFGTLNCFMEILLDATDLLISEGRELPSGGTLPEVVVVGDQSDGKSTLLEVLSGVQLPKGGGLSTLCPIRLIIRTAGPDSPTIYRINGEELEPGSDYSTALKNAMKESAGEGKDSITEKPIEVKVVGPGLPNLTVVDLPGITRNTPELEQKTVQLIENYISNENAIIVVVAKASNDIETSKGAQVAKSVDPDGERTVLVVTHCDGLIKEESASKLIDEPRKLVCFVNCVLKSSKTQDREARFEEEEQFFIKHQYEGFHNLDESQRGTRALIRLLVKILCEKLNRARFEIMKSVEMLDKETDDWLVTAKMDDANLMQKVDKLIFETRTNFACMVVGHTQSGVNDLYHSCREAWSVFGKKIKRISEEMLVSLSNAMDDRTKKPGEEPAVLPNHFPALKGAVTDLVLRFEQAAKPMVKQTQDIIRRHMHSAIKEKLGCYGYLHDKVRAAADQKLDKYQLVAEERVMEILDMQTVIFDSPETQEQLEKLLYDTETGDFFEKAS